jgi:hypothetical protein
VPVRLDVGRHKGVAAFAQRARGDIEVTLPPPHGPNLRDISMIHPRCTNYVAATSHTKGAATALHDSNNYRENAGHRHPGDSVIVAPSGTTSHSPSKHTGKLL